MVKCISTKLFKRQISIREGSYNPFKGHTELMKDHENII